VVMNESLKDTVKITVIATGFQRDNLPQLARRAVASAAAEPILFEPTPPPPPAPMPAPVAEPLFSSGLSAGSSLFREMPPPEPEAEPEIPEPAPMSVDDLEVPAFMRRERRLYQ
jgi:hypothetical protein